MIITTQSYTAPLQYDTGQGLKGAVALFLRNVEEKHIHLALSI